MKLLCGFIMALLLVGGCVQTGFCQRLDFKKYSVSEGLPQAQVHDIAQTKDGYIWIATYGGGLVKFDGHQFVSYTTEDGLTDNTVEKIVVDSEDNIWVATAKGGVATFRGDSLVYPFKSDSLHYYGITGMEVLNDGSLWFGTFKGGVFKYDGQKLTRITKADGLLSNTVWNFSQDDDGKIWMATHKGVSVYDQKSFKNYTTRDGVSGTKTYKIIETLNDDKWISTDNGLSIWDGTHFETITQINGQALDSVFDIMQSSDGKIWIGTENHGVYVYNKGKFSHFTTKNGLSSNRIYKFFEDRSHHIWIATDEDGVNVYKDEGFTFYDKETGLHHNGVLSINRNSNGMLWLGTLEGVETFNGKHSTVYPLPKPHKPGYIWNIEDLPNGNELIEMPDNTLMTFDGTKFTNFSEKLNLGDEYVYDLFVDSKNHLWLCTDSNGLFEYSFKTKELKHYTSDDGLANNTVYTIFEDKKGRKWIGTLYGLSIFNGKHFKNVRVENGLGHNEVHYITQGPKGNIWLGTGGGVTLYKPAKPGASPEIYNFDKRNGMALVNTHFLWFDKKDYLWQGTNGGLQMLDVPTFWKTGTMSVTHYSLSNEGVGLEFNYHALSAEGHKTAWMGSMKGVVKLNSDALKRHPSAPTLNITNITLNSLPIEWHKYKDSLVYHNGMLKLPKVTFPPGGNGYGFSFSGLSFANPKNVRYRYKLMGFEKDWMPVTSNNSATYTNLSPGDYTFVVEARNGGGKFSSKAAYSFSVAYPFWRTYWFYSLMAITLIGLIFGYTRVRINYLEKNRLKELVNEKTKDLQAALEEKEVLIKEIHHRVKNNLAVISGLLELQVQHSEDEFSTKILRESQRRIQSISMIHEKLYQNDRLSQLDFSKYIKELVDVISYSNSQFEKEIDVNISTGAVRMGIDQGIPCGLIINELISNAYEHAFKGKKSGAIDIRFERIGGTQIRLSVEDDGIGLPDDFEKQQAEPQSLGMVLVKTLTTQLEGTFSFKRLQPGSIFIVEFEKEKPPHIPIES